MPAVSLAQPKRGAPQEEIVLPGNIQAFIDAPIYARTNGYLKRWYVDIGGRVKTGQLLAEIDTPELDQQLQQATGGAGDGQGQLRPWRKPPPRATRFLLKSDSVAKQDVDNAVGDAHAKKAMVDSATDNVKRLEQLQSFEKVYAPFDGVLTARNTDIGQLIGSGSGSGAKELFHVAAIHTLRVYVNVPQIYSPAAVPGVQAYLTMPQFPGRRFPGKLVRTSAGDRPGLPHAAGGGGCCQPHRRNPARGLFRSPFEASLGHLDRGHPGNQPDLPLGGLARRRGPQQPRRPDSHNPRQGLRNEVEVVSGLDGSEKVITNPPDSLVDGQEVRSATAGAGSWGGE